MPSIDNWSDSPRDIIQQIYERHNGNQEWEKEAENYFSSKLSNPLVWNSIVSLNEVPIKDVKNGQVVRFRGMVQDQLGVEMFGSGAVVKNSASGAQRKMTGKYQDELSLNDHEEVVNWNETESRHCYYIVPIPGETAWVKQAHQEKFIQLDWKCPESAPCGKKRPLEDEEMDVENDGSEFKRPRPVNQASGAASLSSSNLDKILNYPLPSSETIGCIVKIYSESELMLNQVTEVVGILSFNTPGFSEEKEEFQPPSSIIPRLHSLATVLWDHNNPLLGQCSTSTWKDEMSRILAAASGTRDELHCLFTELFKGDTLAADYLLCHLASNIYCRKDALALGKLGLNITGVPVAGSDSSPYHYTSMIYNLLATLVTKAHYLPMSLQNMNTLRLIPKKDYNENRLLAGRLQLSSHTHLVLDETAMSEGQLISEGVRNMTALGNLVTWQKIEYDFNFHNVEFPTDVPVLILSERKSLIPSDVRLPLSFNEGCSGAREPHVLIDTLEKDPALVNRMRQYLTVIRLTEFNLGAHMEEIVQQEFIQSRAPGKENPMSPEDFHLLLVLSRLLALTYGVSELTETIWRRAVAMESERHSRISNAQR